MKDEWRMMQCKGLMMKDGDFKLLRGFADRQTNKWTDKRTDIGDCRVSFATKKESLQTFGFEDLRLGLQLDKKLPRICHFKRNPHQNKNTHIDHNVL